MSLRYLRLQAGQALPPIGDGSPFRAVLILAEAAQGDWRDLVCRRLVEAGCLYAVAWGVDCDLWHDSVDWAALKADGFGDIPEERFVMTTWHEDETLAEALWFAAHAAVHPTVELVRTVLIDIGPEDRREQMLEAWETARLEAAAVEP